MLKKVLYIAALTCMFGTLVSANPYGEVPSVSGTSGGGTQGTTNASGSLSVSNGGVFSNDSATASTSANSYGTIGAMVVVRYQTQNSGENSVSKDSIKPNSLTTSVSQSAPTNYGTYATGGHTYSSTNYGSWAGSTSLDF